jgi:hypothetical protein
MNALGARDDRVGSGAEAGRGAEILIDPFTLWVSARDVRIATVR